jgi:hypothetical protein
MHKTELKLEEKLKHFPVFREIFGSFRLILNFQNFEFIPWQNTENCGK